MLRTEVRYEGAGGQPLADYLRSGGYHAPLVVADPNTYRAAGRMLSAGLRAAGVGVEDFVLDDDTPSPDARSVGDVLIGMSTSPDIVIGVGGGTVTDIARLVAHRMDRPLISYPTAPSVDAFSSPTSAMIFRGVKKTVPARSPELVFAHPDVLTAAPHEMIAAGFGDMMAKLTAAVDWRLSALVFAEPFDAGIVERVRQAVDSCVREVDGIGRHETEAVCTLLDGLVESGDCMREWNGSRPASGSEHLLSHFFEMQAHKQGRHGALHGSKVAVGTIAVAAVFRRLARMGAEELARRVSNADPPDRTALQRQAVVEFGEEEAATLLSEHPFTTMSEGHFRRLSRQIADRAGEIIDLADAAPDPAYLIDLMRRAGGPTQPADIGIETEDLRTALSVAHLIRTRFGLLPLVHLFRLFEPAAVVEEWFG
ncbi:MAG: sn-glycerol-1-phosphate dehydrogenase [Spirochaetaceae bacterium]